MHNTYEEWWFLLFVTVYRNAKKRKWNEMATVTVSLKRFAFKSVSGISIENKLNFRNNYFHSMRWFHLTECCDVIDWSSPDNSRNFISNKTNYIKLAAPFESCWYPISNWNFAQNYHSNQNHSKIPLENCATAYTWLPFKINTIQIEIWYICIWRVNSEDVCITHAIPS